jgi:hypothetical protein
MARWLNKRQVKSLTPLLIDIAKRDFRARSLQKDCLSREFRFAWNPADQGLTLKVNLKGCYTDQVTFWSRPISLESLEAIIGAPHSFGSDAGASRQWLFIKPSAKDRRRFERLVCGSDLGWPEFIAK